ncbi:MAG: hypothetical protein DRH24_08810 [Deltaproteobacteria bacterium]|nr:MAG: hypothetical protein DRH24_08810 [Deltaproteobacteria bacterium]
MALTNDEIFQIHEILEVPFPTDGHLRLMQENARSSLHFAGGMLTDSTSNDLLAYLQAINDVERETRIRTILSQWSDLDPHTVGITNGGVGAIAGVTWNPWKERQHLRKKLQTYVPYFRDSEFNFTNNPMLPAITSVEIVR